MPSTSPYAYSSSDSSHSFNDFLESTVSLREAQHRQHLISEQRHETKEQGHELQDLSTTAIHSTSELTRENTSPNKTRTPHLIIITTPSPSSIPSPTEFANRTSTDSMPAKKSRKNLNKSPARRGASSSSYVADSPNGSANGDMNGIEQRRKHTSLDSPSTTSQASHLMARERFSLDNEVPDRKEGSEEAIGFFELPMQDRKNFLLLVLLYFLQGIPMGLATGSVPFLLKPFVSYSEIGVFSLASYPYSLKLLWSPIVDAIWTPKLGRRKSWILPVQMLSGFGMLYLSTRVETLMQAAGTGRSAVWEFTWWWFSLVFMCATQDIAVDGKQFLLTVFVLC